MSSQESTVSRSKPGSLRRITSFAVISFVLLTELAIAGQGSAPSSIVGRVTDETGGVLPGVSVTAKSPALQVTQLVAVTDAQGEYRLNPLPIGVYSVEYALDGFQTLRQDDVVLSVGFVAKLDKVLKVGAINETVTVAGSPVVDVVSTVVRTELSQAALEVLPTSRDGLRVFMGQAPGVRTTFAVGSSGGSIVAFRAYGQSGEAWDMLEGVMMSRPSGGLASGTHIDFDSIDGVRVQTVGNNAEMARRGILVDAIMKSGGNQFHGTGGGIYQSSRFQSANIDDTLRAQGISAGGRLRGRYEYNGGLGGKIIENKLWFYGAGRRRKESSDVLNAFYDDGRPIETEFRQDFHLEKLSYQMTPGNRLIGFNHWSQDFESRGASQFRPAESRETLPFQFYTWKAEWAAVRGNSLTTSLQYGGWLTTGQWYGLTSKPATLDIATMRVSGDAVSDGMRSYWRRRHAKGVLDWYRRSDRFGDHDFKLGFDHLYANWDDSQTVRSSGSYQLLFNNGAPYQINTWNIPTSPKNRDNYLGLYLQDAWRITRRVTFNLGIRYEHDHAFAPEQCREPGDFAAAGCFSKIDLPTWNSVAPRAHVAFDIFGDGKTAIKGGYGRFNHLREINPEVTTLNAHNTATTTWKWNDLNNNRNYDPGEVNLDPINGSDFVTSTGGVAVNALNPNEKQPKADEFSISLERELMANWAVRIGGVYSRNFNTYRRLTFRRPYSAYNIPITNRDPGPDNRLGTADDPGTLVTYYDFPVTFRGSLFEQGMLINDPNADQTFRTIEVASAKRLSNNWQFMASYSATKLNVPFGPSNPALAFNPNAEIFTANRTWEWIGKASGAYNFPSEIIASANFEHRSGDPGARQVLFSGGTQIPSIVLNVEPIGSRRLPNVNLLDLSVAKRFALQKGHASIRFEVFNALNINTARSWTLRSGPSFLVPTSIVAPRIAQVSTSYEF